MNELTPGNVACAFAFPLFLRVVFGLCLAGGLAGADGHAGEMAHLPLTVDFAQVSDGEYTPAALEQQWGDIGWQTLYGRATVVPVNSRIFTGKALSILYPKGSVGSKEGGAQFLVKLPPAPEYWLTYRLCFESGFDFKLGGKLPGLTSGGSKYTGGHPPKKGDGWSARFMWRKEGQAVLYLYYIDMPGKYGEDLPLEGVTFSPNRWYQLTEHVRVNTPGNKDGLIEVWSGVTKVLTRTDLRLRVGEKGLADSFYFSTFHGGDTAEWAPAVDCAALFADFRIDREPPPFLAPFLTKY